VSAPVFVDLFPFLHWQGRMG